MSEVCLELTPEQPLSTGVAKLNSRSAMVVMVLGLGHVLAACSEPPAPAPLSAPGTNRITGWLLEKLDHPPYSYLRLKTETGEVWAAVPVAHVSPEKPATVLNGVALRNYTIGSTGRRLDVVYFGVLAPAQARP